MCTLISVCCVAFQRCLLCRQATVGSNTFSFYISRLETIPPLQEKLQCMRCKLLVFFLYYYYLPNAFTLIIKIAPLLRPEICNNQYPA